MDASIKLVIIGGAISLLSTLAGIFLQHRFERQRVSIQMKQHAAQVLYGKQMEFFSMLPSILLGIDKHVLTIEMWLDTPGEDAKLQIKEIIKSDVYLAEFDKLIKQYYLYLPKDLLEDTNKLLEACKFLNWFPTFEYSERCRKRSAAFQNLVRKLFGIDTLSTNLIESFGLKKQNIKGDTESY